MSKTSTRVLSMVLTVFMVISMLTVFSVAGAAPFAEAYDGTVISKQALLVDSTITEDAGATVTRAWDGKDYTFVVGANAFKTNAEVYEFIKDKLENGTEAEKEYFACPDIIVLAVDNTNFLIDTASNVYSPAWNTVPMNEMGDMAKVGAAGNGVDWTENADYAAKSISIIPIFDGDVAGTMGVYGFTFESKIYLKGIDGWGGGRRSNAELVANINIVNSVVDTNQAIAWDAYYTNADEQDTITFKNLYFKTVQERAFYDGAFPAHVVIDGMYIDFDKIVKPTANKNVFAKQYSAGKTSFVVKNSNMRGTMAGYGATPYSSWVICGYRYNGDTVDKAVTITNNTLAYKDAQGVAMINYPSDNINSNHPTTAAAGGITSYIYTDNYIDASLGGCATLVSRSFPAAENITYSGNKIVGYTGVAKLDTNSTVVSTGNFVTSATSDFENAVGIETVGAPYYFDYAMTYGSAGVTVTGVEVQGTATVEDSKITILLDGASNTKLTGASFVTGETDKAVTKTLYVGGEAVESYDLATFNGVETLTLKVAYNENYVKEYDVTIINTQIESFNTKLANEVTINGVKFTTEDTAVYLPTDAKIYELGEEKVAYLKFAGTTYKFVIDDENVFGNNAADMSAVDGFTNIILPAGYYGDLNILGEPANYYGAYMGVNPIDKSGASAENNYDWALNAAWDFEYDSDVRRLTIPATAYGKIVVEGITISKDINDSNRAAENESADITYKNIVHNAVSSDATAVVYMHGKRSNPGGENIADKVTFQNYYVKNFKSNQFFHEWNAPTLTLDNFYWNTGISNQARNLIAMFKFAAATPNKTLTIKNSNIRTNERAASYAPIRIDQGNGVNVVIENNILVSSAGCGVIQFAGQAYAVNDVAINNNIIIANGSTTLFANYVNPEAELEADGNTIIGYPASAVALGGIPLTNTFVATDASAMTSTGATGVYVAAMGENDYWLDYARTVKGSELVLENAAVGTSDVEVSAVAEETKSLIVTLGAKKTTEGMVMTIGETATGKWLNAEKAEVAAATAAGTYYYRVTSTKTPSVYVDYTVTVLGAPSQPFNTAYDVDGEGEIKNTAVLVDTSITEATGTEIEREWDGDYYKFTVGTNAFASLDAAYAAIADLDVAVPQIIVTNYSGSIVVKQPIDIYATNWNTTPMNEMGDMSKVGAKANGIDWTVNAAYEENQITIANLVFDGSFVCDEDEFVKVAGFTVTGSIVTDGDTATKRTPGNRINVELVNFKADSTAGWLFDHHQTVNDKAALISEDTLIVKNMRYVGAGNRFWCGDGPATPNLVIDGLYVDFDTISVTANTFIKSPAWNSSITLKNSNLQGTMTHQIAFAWTAPYHHAVDTWKMGAVSFDENIGYSRAVIIENNTISHTAAGAINKNNKPSQLYVESASTCTEITYKDNYFDMDGVQTGATLYSYDAPGTLLSKIDPNGTLECNVTFTGNKVVNKAEGVSVFSWGDAAPQKAPVAYDNYIASAVAADYTNVPGTGYNKEVEGGSYYLDYAMTIKSDIIYDGYTVTDIGRNMIISKAATADEEGEILYAYDDKVVNNEGTITVNLAHIIDGVNALNSATIYTDDASADVETGTLTLTADANNEATLKLSIWSSDKTKAITWNIKLTDPVHNWSDWTLESEATCQKLAVEKRVCAGDCMVAETCTAFETREVGELADHVYENYTVSSTATCEAAGTVTGRCKWCDATDVKENAEDPKKAHAGEKVGGQVASCTTDGWNAYYACKNGCNKLYADENCTVVIEDLEAWKKGNGKIAGGHKLDKVDGQKATCTVDGWKDYYKCSVCGALFADAEGKTAIADLEAWKKADGKIAAGHVWGAWVYNNDATEEADGTETRKCTVCTEGTETRTAEGTKLAPSVEIKDTTAIFKDVKAKKWYTEAINYCYSYGFIAGTSADTFGLNTNVTRGMFITILARIAGVDTGKAANKVDTKFTDVKSGKYYVAAIKWASDNGIVKGTSDTTFGPENAISRQDLCVMIVNYANFMKVELTAAEAEITFKDASSIRKYAREAVKVCQMADIVNGYANGAEFDFKPTNTATRAEAAVILFKFHSNFMK